jgi:hypothetical protein
MATTINNPITTETATETLIKEVRTVLETETLTKKVKETEI